MISVYSFTIQNGTCQRPRTLWNRSATKFVLPSEKSTRQMRLENGQSQLFDNIQNLFVKERFINQINSLIPKFEKKNFKQIVKRKFIPRIYFIRKVGHDEKRKKGEISILNERINLPKAYVNLFTLSEWNLKTETLKIMFEKGQKKKVIKIIKFKINKKSKNGVTHFI